MKFEEIPDNLEELRVYVTRLTLEMFIHSDEVWEKVKEKFTRKQKECLILSEMKEISI